MASPAAPVETVASGSPAPDEASVKPGINDRYREETKPKRWAKRFEREGREVHDHRVEIVDALELKPGMRVADVGAGTGMFTVEMARRVGADGRVFAVDLQPYFLEHIRGRAQAEGLTQIATVQAGERSAGLAEGSVDLIFLCDAYHHLEYPRAYLESMRQALRPGGALVIIDYRRIPGTTRKWLLEHVRAGKDVVTSEISEAGFALEREQPGLQDNYFLVFRRE